MILQANIPSYIPKPLVPASFVGVSDAAHCAGLERFYRDTNPEKIGQVGPILYPMTWFPM